MEKTGLPKATVYPKPLDWLEALYWVERKLQKCTKVCGHKDKLPHCGKIAFRDFFEELCVVVNTLYPTLNKPENFEYYFAFGKYSPFKPDDKIINLEVPF